MMVTYIWWPTSERWINSSQGHPHNFRCAGPPFPPRCNRTPWVWYIPTSDGCNTMPWPEATGGDRRSHGRSPGRPFRVAWLPHLRKLEIDGPSFIFSELQYFVPVACTCTILNSINGMDSSFLVPHGSQTKGENKTLGYQTEEKTKGIVLFHLRDLQLKPITHGYMFFMRTISQTSKPWYPYNPEEFHFASFELLPFTDSVVQSQGPLFPSPRCLFFRDQVCSQASNLRKKSRGSG